MGAPIIYNVIVAASNDNESSQVTLPGSSICVPVPVIRGPAHLLTMAEVAEVEDGVVIIDSLRKDPFLLALRRWGRFAWRNVCDSAAEIPYWWLKSIIT